MNNFKQQLEAKTGDKKLIENLFSSFEEISREYVSGDPVGLLQNTGLFVESVLRVTEHLVLGTHTSLSSRFNVDDVIDSLERANGPEGLRIHVARMSRVIYDFRSRKKAVHLKDIDPQLIDANLVFGIANWILIEILKEGGLVNPEEEIKKLVYSKIPLVQAVEGILRTTNPKLSGPQRILLLLYSSPTGLTEEDLLNGTRTRIKNMNHLGVNLRDLDGKDLVHYKKSENKWVLFGQGIQKAELIIADFANT